MSVTRRSVAGSSGSEAGADGRGLAGPSLVPSKPKRAVDGIVGAAAGTDGTAWLASSCSGTGSDNKLGGAWAGPGASAVPDVDACAPSPRVAGPWRVAGPPC